ncbi:hypothetical protein [Streptomyces werraensis]|uniref:hypothetical protein n=1 Tax=Streptomyces werraensis TaxID=68284 RepID=UPI00342F0AB3
MEKILHPLPLTAAEAVPLKHAAFGAARIATQGGKAELSERLMARARMYNRVARRRSTRNAAPLPVPDVKTMVPVKPTDGTFRAVVAELGRTGGLADWRIVGSAAPDDQPFRPLIARMEGDAIQYMQPAPPPVTTPKKAKKEVKESVPKKAAKESAPKKSKAAPVVQATKIADLPEQVRELAKVAKEKGLVGAEWTSLGALDWDGQMVQVFVRVTGRVTRYGIAAA